MHLCKPNLTKYCHISSCNAALGLRHWLGLFCPSESIRGPYSSTPLTTQWAAVHRGLHTPTFLPTLVYFQLSHPLPVWWMYSLIDCISLITVEFECFFTCLLAFLVCSSGNCLFICLAHFPTEVAPLFLSICQRFLAILIGLRHCMYSFLCQSWQFVLF